METGKRGARDRRRHPRFDDDARLLCIGDAGEGGFCQARLTELSMGGMQLTCSRAFEPGGHVYVGVLIEEAQEPLVVIGVVQHCDATEGGASLGLEFLGVDDQQKEGIARLADYLKRRHGEAAAVTLCQAPAIRRIGEERWW